MRKFLLLGTCLLALSACNMNNQTAGALLGAGAGGLLGNTVGSGSGRTAAIIGGTLLGTLAGSSLGADLDNPQTVIVQQPQSYNYSECSHLTNPGIRASCERGAADRNQANQREAEQRAYQCSRYGRCN